MNPAVLRPKPKAAVALVLSCLACGGGETGPDAGDGGMDMNADMAMAHGDHDPRYGGFVFMHGDLHFEVVLDPAGEHRLYFSDAVRNELPAAVVSEVRISVRRAEDPENAERLRPEIDDFGEAWIARGRPVDAAEDAIALVGFRFEGLPYEIEVPFVMEPPDPSVDPHAGMDMTPPRPPED